MPVLTVNAGSSSIRLARCADDGSTRLASAHFVGADAGRDPRALLRAFLGEERAQPIAVVAHRIVHGGARLTEPCFIDAAVMAEIERVAPLAPLHNPVALRWIEACAEVLGKDVRQIAVFDTAFYARLPEAARHYALPRALCEKHGLRRYGFHGLAHESMWRRWRALRPEVRDGGRVISLQLGGGCSVTAVQDGRAIDTSMGFTPLEGLVMATRAGDLDPGLLMFLQRAEVLSTDRLERMLRQESGLHGMAGTADMRALLVRADGDAKLAIEVYCYRARKYVGAYVAALGGVDAILFGGGVGEHAPLIRANILIGLEIFGIELDAALNDGAIGVQGRISREGSSVEVWVMPADEAWMLARAALDLIGKPTTAAGALD